MHARYADGRTALALDAALEAGPEALSFTVGGQTHTWTYAELARADDGNGRISFKRKPDTGERLYITDGEDYIRAVAPALFEPGAHGVEHPGVVGAVIAGAWAVAAAFLIGVPMAAGPIAAIMPPQYREQIADISWSQVNALTDHCDDSDEAAAILNDMAYRMMEASNVRERDDIWITIVSTDRMAEPFPNAFALPDDSIIVTDDLIELAEHPDEVTGVLAHEIAHIERNHVMKGVIRQMGAGIFFDVVFGGAGAGQAIAIASVNLAGLRYSRDDESEADARGLDYLEAAGISSAGLARLFDRIRDLQSDGEIPTLLSSHPATEARAQRARDRAREGLQPSLTDTQWQAVRRACHGGAPPVSATPAPAPEAPAAPKPEAPPPTAPGEKSE